MDSNKTDSSAEEFRDAEAYLHEMEREFDDRGAKLLALYFDEKEHSVYPIDDLAEDFGGIAAFLASQCTLVSIIEAPLIFDEYAGRQVAFRGQLAGLVFCETRLPTSIDAKPCSAITEPHEVQATLYEDVREGEPFAWKRRATVFDELLRDATHVDLKFEDHGGSSVLFPLVSPDLSERVDVIKAYIAEYKSGDGERAIVGHTAALEPRFGAAVLCLKIRKFT